jgi:hypothetical protein
LGSGHFALDVAEESFGPLHEVVERGFRGVEFADGKFWVVSGVDAFVAEDGAEFVDALHAADDEALQPEFGGDAQVESFALELGGFCFERSCNCSACAGLQDGRVDFDEVLCVEEVVHGALDDVSDAQSLDGSRVH